MNGRTFRIQKHAIGSKKTYFLGKFFNILTKTIVNFPEIYERERGVDMFIDSHGSNR